MQRIYYHITPADLKGNESGFIPVPGRIRLKQGSPIIFCLDTGRQKLPLQTAVRVKVGDRRFGKPKIAQNWVRATGKGWQLDFQKLSELRSSDDSGEITVQPGIWLESKRADVAPLVLAFYVDDDADTYGMAGGQHGNVPCPDLANDIQWHENHLADLGEIKKGCAGASGGGSDNGGTISGGEGDGGFGFGVTLSTDGADAASELCASIDFMITTAEKDLADAKEEYNKRCRGFV